MHYFQNIRKLVSIFILIHCLSRAICEPKTSGKFDSVDLNDIKSLPPQRQNEVQYDYRYAVDDPKSGVISDRWEKRHGEYVKGQYSFLEPNGRVRTVDYEVDGDKGFRAVIRTDYPGNKFLSTQQLYTSRYVHKNPPVNILTNQPESSVVSNIVDNIQANSRQGRVIVKRIPGLPINFHSIRPNYYLSFVKGQKVNYTHPASRPAPPPSDRDPVTQLQPDLRNSSVQIPSTIIEPPSLNQNLAPKQFKEYSQPRSPVKLSNLTINMQDLVNRKMDKNTNDTIFGANIPGINHDALKILKAYINHRQENNSSIEENLLDRRNISFISAQNSGREPSPFLQPPPYQPETTKRHSHTDVIFKKTSNPSPGIQIPLQLPSAAKSIPKLNENLRSSPIDGGELSPAESRRSFIQFRQVGVPSTYFVLPG